MKNINKISIIIIILMLISLIFSNCSQASEISNIFSSADSFLGKGNAINQTINEIQLKETSKFMYKLLMAVGIIVMFIVGTIIGIQYMIASAEDKAKVKEALVPYIVGCFVIFGAFIIWSIAVNIGQDITGTSSGTSSDSGTSSGTSSDSGTSSGTSSGSTRSYTTTKGTWYWCKECDKELSESERRDQECAISRSHDVYVRKERYYCKTCGDEWDEDERRQQGCDDCR